MIECCKLSYSLRWNKPKEKAITFTLGQIPLGKV